ncbi:hypothetical protein RYA05_03980 [Pseudomonas syringae pv. actinidiae]|nr:hypothetical protein [Pseudomonas syringae pv. actinidiae]
MQEERKVDIESPEGRAVFDAQLFSRVMNQLNKVNPGLSAVMIKEAGTDLIRQAYPKALKDAGFELTHAEGRQGELQGGYELVANRSHINESILARSLFMNVARLHAPGVAANMVFRVPYEDRSKAVTGLTFTI